MSRLTWLWVVFLTLPLVTAPFDKSNRMVSYLVYSRVTLWIVLQQVLVIAAVILTRFAVLKFVPAMDRSLYSFFGAGAGTGTGGGDTNFNMIPVHIKFFGPIYLALFFFSLPRLAFWEEQIFREGADTLWRGILMSIVFGFAHCIVGVSFASGAALSVAGFWFWLQYRAGGTSLSTTHHTAYNAILVSILLVATIAATLLPSSK